MSDDATDDRMVTIELVVVTMRFDASTMTHCTTLLRSVLAKYVVLTRDGTGLPERRPGRERHHEPGRHLVIEKWESPGQPAAHFDATVMVEMASGCTGLLSRAARHRPLGRDERARPALTSGDDVDPTVSTVRTCDRADGRQR